MQSVATLNQQILNDHAERQRALNSAARQLVLRLFGCWQHELTRPFTRNGKTYRVCVKCGLSRDFNLNTWETHGASYTQPVSNC
jgi:hypothetical protein